MLGDPETGSGLDGPGPEGIPAAGKAPCHRSFCTLWQAGGQRGLTEVIAPPTFHIVLFGAGHVGQALVPILGTLTCTVAWVDERDTQFQPEVPVNVVLEDTDTPAGGYEQAPP